MHSAWIVMLTLMLEGVHVLQQSFDAVLIGEVHDIIISFYTLDIVVYITLSPADQLNAVQSYS